MTSDWEVMVKAGAFSRTQSPPRYGQRGVIIVAILVAHGLVLLGLMMTHLVDRRVLTIAPETTLVLIPLPPDLEKPKRSRSGLRRRSGAVLPEYRWVTPGGAPGSNAITIFRIPPYVAKGPPPCPKILRPGTPEWEARCGSQTASGEENPNEYAFTPSRELDLKHRGIWEEELRARNKVEQVPCTYVHNFPADGGPPPPPARMMDVGCAAKQLFGR